jgi:CubicO group peptidase (beta-lactamase class C family)
VDWPTERWPEAALDADVDAQRIDSALRRVFREPPPEAFGETHAVLVAHRGRLVLERYAPDHARDERFISWSMAKSFTHALVGVLVGEGKLDLGSPAPVPAWRSSGDPRGDITLEHLLRMVDGLEFVEDYVDAGVSHVIDMLFGSGKEDVAAYAEARPAAHAPGEVWSYSSGTSNVVAAILGRAVGGGADGMLAFMRRVLFDPIGMRSAEPRFDTAGTFIGSSFVFARARDFARFGLLYLRGGVWGDEAAPVLPAGWVDHARTLTPGSDGEYGAHWWLGLGGADAFHASGYRGQYTLVVPTRDLVVVRLGGSTPEQRENVRLFLTDLVESFPVTRKGA